MTEPILTGLLGDAWAAKPDKPTALGTPLRYSSAHGCSRQMAYYALGAKKTEDVDGGDVWAAGIGTLIHEAMQAEIGKVYITAQFELSSKLGNYLSGSTDALVESREIKERTGDDLGGTHVLWELKSMGEWAFDNQMGYNRKSMKVYNNGHGPKRGAVAQAGMNALGIEASDPAIRIETVLMGSVCVTTLSVSKAKQMEVEGFDRYGAEFTIPRNEWEPLALAELGRMELIGLTLEHQTLPDRIAWDESELYLNPRGKDWQCDYCPFRSLCVSDGEGEIPLEQSWMVKK